MTGRCTWIVMLASLVQITWASMLWVDPDALLDVPPVHEAPDFGYPLSIFGLYWCAATAMAAAWWIGRHGPTWWTLAGMMLQQTSLTASCVAVVDVAITPPVATEPIAILADGAPLLLAAVIHFVAVIDLHLTVPRGWSPPPSQ